MSPQETSAVEVVAPEDWDRLLARLEVTDVYYSRGFVEASAALTGGAPRLLHLPGERGGVVFPCLVRRDPVDVVTPYGYGGPLPAGADPPAEAFPAAYQQWCEQAGAVSTFVVFHPLFGNHVSPANAGFRRTALADTVAWPLDAADLEAAMHAHHRRVVRRARRAGLEASVAERPDDLEEFVAVYEATMDRADADAFYLFGADYWERLLHDVPLVRVDVRHEGELAASVLGMGRRPWLHYHLGGSTAEGRRLGASHLALFTLARWGRENGYQRLHLGGGVGGRADSLREYKLRFAPGGLAPAQIGKAVHDPSEYARLTGSGEIDWDGFFPAYRAR